MNTSKTHPQAGQFSQSTSFLDPTEDLKLLKGQERFLCNWVGWKGERGSGTSPGSLGGSWKEEMFLISGKPLHQWGAQKWSFRGSEANPAASLQQTEQRGLHGQSSHPPGLPVWDTSLLLRTGAGCWDSEFRGLAWGEEWSWLLRGSLKGLDSDPAQQGVFLEEAQPSTVATHHC